MLGANQYSRTYGAPAQELRPDFYMDTIKDEPASAVAGRDIHREVERVRIIIPGAVASIVVKNVDDTHRQRWPQEYTAFKAGQEQPLIGTALKEWPVLNRAMVEELHFLQIRTVEELANLSDFQVQRMGMGGQMLRQRARAYLDEAEHEALLTKTTAENEVLRSRIAALEAQVNELGQLMAASVARERRLGDERPAFQTYVPGAVERQPFQGGTIAAPPSSSLDALAELPPPRQRGNGDVNFDPAAAGSRAEAA